MRVGILNSLVAFFFDDLIGNGSGQPSEMFRSTNSHSPSYCEEPPGFWCIEDRLGFETHGHYQDQLARVSRHHTHVPWFFSFETSWNHPAKRQSRRAQLQGDSSGCWTLFSLTFLVCAVFGPGMKSWLGGALLHQTALYLTLRRKLSIPACQTACTHPSRASLNILRFDPFRTVLSQVPTGPSRRSKIRLRPDVLPFFAPQPFCVCIGRWATIQIPMIWLVMW